MLVADVRDPSILMQFDSGKGCDDEHQMCSDRSAIQVISQKLVRARGSDVAYWPIFGRPDRDRPQACLRVAKECDLSTSNHHSEPAHYSRLSAQGALGSVDSYLIHRIVAAIVTTARKFCAVFSYRVATRLNCLSFEKQHSTR